MMAYPRRDTIHTPDVRLTQIPEGEHGIDFYVVPFTRQQRAFNPDTRGRHYISIMLPA